LGLSRERSDSRRYPAIDPGISWSKYTLGVGKELSHRIDDWAEMVIKADLMLREGIEIGKRMEVVGEEGTAVEDFVIHLKAELYDFTYLQQNAFDEQDAYCPLERQIELFILLNRIFDKKFKFRTHSEGREYFINLSNIIKNMNYLPRDSREYRETMTKVEEMVKHHE